jgi:hypothetical protein
MSNRSIKFLIAGISTLAIVFALVIGIFWSKNQSTIVFIQKHKALFLPTFKNSPQNVRFDYFLNKVNKNPQILKTLRQNEKALQNGALIVSLNNEELGYYEDEVQFPLQCEDEAKACSSVRTALTAARENSLLAYKLAFQYWVEESNNRPDPIDTFNFIFDACLYMDGENGFHGCQILSEQIIDDTRKGESGKDLSKRIQMYAIERSIANYRYDYDFFEATVNRFFNDRALRSLIQDDFTSVSTFLWLPDPLRGEFDIDFAAYQEAKIFAKAYPQVLAYLIQN